MRFKLNFTINDRGSVCVHVCGSKFTKDGEYYSLFSSQFQAIMVNGALMLQLDHR